MKRTLLKVLSLCLLLAVLAGGASALAEPHLRKLTLWLGATYATAVEGLEHDTWYEILSVKSSKPKVLKVRFDDGGTLVDLKPLRPGKSTVTVTYMEDDDSHTVSATYKVKKYPKPFVWIKVNGKSVNLKKKKFAVTFDDYRKKNVKVQFKLKKGWRIASLPLSTWNDSESSEATWKNGDTIELPMDRNAFLGIELRKGDDTFSYALNFFRDLPGE